MDGFYGEEEVLMYLIKGKCTLREAFEGYLRVVLETEESRTAFLKEICSAMNLEKCISFMGSR